MSTKTEELNIHHIIRERRSVRYFDIAFKLNQTQLAEMIEEAMTAPSSNNLQPWRLLVITDQKRKELLYPIASSQKSILDASAIIILMGDLEAYKLAEKIDDYGIAEGLTTAEKKAIHLEKVQKNYAERSAQLLREIAKIDCGLFAMQFMLIAKAKGYDTLPIGGFDHEKLKEAFRFPVNLVPVMLIAIGKAAKPPIKTPRLKVEDVTYWEEI